MTEATKGVIALIAASVIWGLSPIVYKSLSHVPALEVLSHRTLWSLVFFVVLLSVQRRLGAAFQVFQSRAVLGKAALATVVISLNWFAFIVAVQIGLTVEASLGYFVFPLMAVALGRLFFSEMLDTGKWLAVALATLAVLILTVGLGQPPWVALFLGFSFAIYSSIKKTTGTGPVVSVSGEMLLMLPFAMFWLFGAHTYGWYGFGEHAGGAFLSGTQDTLLLILAGPITAGPLVLFSYASRRTTLATVGLISYINPSLQFFCAVAIFAEPFTKWHGIAFPMIWLALAIYSVQTIRQERRSRSAATNAATSSTGVMNDDIDASAKP